MEPLDPQPGSPIDPRHAVGRGAVLVRARSELAAGNDLALTDPRRMGKTVLLDLFCASADDGTVALKVDYEGVMSSSEFLLRTVHALRQHQSLPSRARAALGVYFEGAELATGPLTVKAGVATKSATELLTDAIRAVESHLDGRRMVVAMDEVPIAIANIVHNEGPHLAHQLLQSLRNLRREGRSLRWIVCGSIGFHHVLRQCGATEGTINDLVNLPLGPLAAADAERLAHRLLLGIDRAPAEVDLRATLSAFVHHTDGIPFLVHKLAHVLQDLGSSPARPQDVGDAFTAFVEDRDDSRAVTHLVTRLEVYGDDREIAAAVLDKVALDGACPTGVVLEQLQVATAPSQVLDDLVDDHYLLERGDQVSWRYPVLQRIWVLRRRLR